MNRRSFLATLGAATVATVALAAEKPVANDKVLLVSSDPSGLTLKDSIVEHLRATGYTVVDLGTKKDGETVPYYEAATRACKAIQRGEASRAILFCGTGMGVAITANHFKGIRASVVESVDSTQACRTINNAKVLCMGNRYWGDRQKANEAVDAFLSTPFAESNNFLREAAQKVEELRD